MFTLPFTWEHNIIQRETQLDLLLRVCSVYVNISNLTSNDGKCKCFHFGENMNDFKIFMTYVYWNKYIYSYLCNIHVKIFKIMIVRE